MGKVISFNDKRDKYRLKKMSVNDLINAMIKTDDMNDFDALLNEYFRRLENKEPE